MLSQMRRDTFGSKSEKLDPDQRNLPFEDVEAALGMLAAASEAAEKALGARKAPLRPSERNKGHLPAHLPRIEQVIEPGSILCPPRLRRDAKGAQSHTPQMNLLASGN